MEVTDMIWYLNGFLGEKKSKKKCIGKGAAKTKKQVIQKGLADMCILQVPFRSPESFVKRFTKSCVGAILIMRYLRKIITGGCIKIYYEIDQNSRCRGSSSLP